MRTILRCLATVLVSSTLIAPAFAQQRAPRDTAHPPRGVEGPEMRKQEPKGTGEADAPKAEKKGTRAGSQKPKAPGEKDTPKTEKKDTRAGGQRSKKTDASPKLSPGPEITHDDRKKDPVTR